VSQVLGPSANAESTLSPQHHSAFGDSLARSLLALRKVIRAMGVKEFAAKVRMASPNVLRAINPGHNPTQDTLNRLLKPFRLRLSLAPLTSKCTS
jgi:DNA-binding phage protein